MKEKKNVGKKIFAIGLSTVLVAGAWLSGWFGWYHYHKYKDKAPTIAQVQELAESESTEQTENSAQNTVQTVIPSSDMELVEKQGQERHDLPRLLAFTAVALEEAQASAEYLEFFTEASVQPGNAFNKEVDWSVAWEEGASRASENVSDYLTVHPESDGSTKIAIRCYKAFLDDNIIITVTTREGGFTATCKAIFTGASSNLIFEKTTFETGDVRFGLVEDYEISYSMSDKFATGITPQLISYTLNVPETYTSATLKVVYNDDAYYVKDQYTYTYSDVVENASTDELKLISGSGGTFKDTFIKGVSIDLSNKCIKISTNFLEHYCTLWEESLIPSKPEYRYGAIYDIDVTLTLKIAVGSFLQEVTLTLINPVTGVSAGGDVTI